MERLPTTFYRRPVLEVGRDLLGRTLCRRVGPGRVRRGRIVEVEAYDGPEDRACHGRAGLTARNASMFRPGGVAYVFLVYGMHRCLNLVTGDAGYPAAVLLRAADVEGGPRAASGPGRLTRWFDVGLDLDGASLRGRDLWVEAGAPVDDAEVVRTGRIGVDYAGPWAEVPYRFAIAGHPAVSGPAGLRGKRGTAASDPA